MATLLLYSILFLREVSGVFSFQHSQTSMGREVTLLLWFLWAHGPVQFSCSVMSDSLQSCGLQHTRLPCPSPTPGAYSNSWPLHWWYHPTISSSDMRHDNHLLLPSVFPSIRVFSSESVLRFRWPKYWSFSFSISPSNEYSGLISFRIDWISLQSKGLSRVFSNITV